MAVLKEKKKVNIREVARVAGTSVASVSRALRDTASPNLSAIQRKHILAVCEKLQYYPNEHTRRMFSRRANTVAIYFPPFGVMEGVFDSLTLDPNFGACILGIQKILAENSMQLLLSEMSEDFLASKQHLKMTRGKMVDGIIVWGITQQEHCVLELLNENIPMVMVQNEKPDCNCMKILADDHEGMFSLVKRIIDAGHRKIAVATPPDSSSAGAGRLRGAIDALAAHGLEPAYLTGESGFGYNFGRRAAQEIFSESSDVSCIIASNDMAAWGCIDFAKSRGMRVPDDISVTGADGLKIPGEMVVSSYVSPSYEIGLRGAESLLKLISGNAEAERICLPTAPIIGNTIKVL